MLVRGCQHTCPNCGSDTRVVETGWSVRFQAQARRRKCKACSTQFYTKEELIDGSIMRVVRRNPNVKTTA